MKKLSAIFLLLFSATIAGAEQYPLQVGYPFKCSDVKSPVLRGIPTQVTVKTRCPDGSVKTAIFTAVIDGDTSDISKLDFVEGTPVTGSKATPALDIALSITTPIDGASHTYTAQKLPSHIWFDGPLATSVRYADYKSKGHFRPIFEVTHWHTLNKTHVRVIGENANTEATGELWTDVTIRVNGAVTYHKNAFPMPLASRWVKEFWIGGTPRQAPPKFDLNYLRSTGAIPNYITTITPPKSQLDDIYNQWVKAPKDLTDPGNLQKGMGAAGARPELGPMQNWMTLYLYSGDRRMLEAAKGNADLFASFPIHFREGNPAKKFYGLPVSILDRPTLHLLNLTYNGTIDADKIKPMGDLDSSGWNPDFAHIPDKYSALCLLTGEEWYCEQMTFVGSYVTAYPNGAATTMNVAGCGRGPTGKEGGFPGVRCMSMRAWAWALRNKALTAWLTPDDRTLEKSYYKQVVLDQLRLAEVERGLNPGKDDLWQWGRQEYQAEKGNPQHAWELGNGSFAQDPIDPAKSKAGVSGFESGFVQHNLYRVEELGFPSRDLINWFAKFFDAVRAVDYRWLAAYRYPTVKADGGTVAPAEWASLFLPTFNLAKNWEDQTRGSHGYGWIAAMAGGVPVAVILADPELPFNVQWAIVPR